MADQDKRPARPGWGDKEFQKALQNGSVVLHYTFVNFERKSQKVAQYYSRASRSVVCCIVPKDTFPGVVLSPHECILVWPSQDADVYESQSQDWSKDMTYKRTLGQLKLSPDEWMELWHYHMLALLDGLKKLTY